MQIDNSGPSFVFDSKTTEAIEEGKNRVTLLQVEELRLNKLKKNLEAEVIKLEGDLTYKTKLVEGKEKELADLEVSIHESVKQLNATNKFHGETKKDIETRIRAVELVETNIRDKEKELNDKEEALNERESALKELESNATVIMTDINSKKDKIEAFIKSL